jgi:hypothetical protein
LPAFTEELNGRLKTVFDVEELGEAQKLENFVDFRLDV